jgi:tetratricopeptide (TPR) repeat protein
MFHRWPLMLAAVVPAGLLLYQIPWVQLHVDWRLQVADAFIRSRLNPIGELPQPQILSGSSEPARPTPPPPTPTPEITPTPIPASHRLTAPAHEFQGPNNCGPATLAMYLRTYGWEGDQYNISDVVKPVTADRNVNVDELDYYLRTYAGWLNTVYRVGGTIERIKQFVASGIPVMVEKGHVIEIDYFYQDDYWNGHYALVTGYDDATGEFIYQDTYTGPDERLGYAEFDAFWQQFNRVFMLVYPPEREETVRNILRDDWDEETNRQNALATAQAEIAADSENAFAWFNLGMNQVYFEDYGAAATSFDRARTIGFPMRMLRYQFGPFFAYFNTNRMDDMRDLIDYALFVTPESEETLIWQGWVLHRQGNVNGAIEQFRLAHDANPNSFYVDAALTAVGATP